MLEEYGVTHFVTIHLVFKNEKVNDFDKIFKNRLISKSKLISNFGVSYSKIFFIYVWIIKLSIIFT